MYYVEQLKFGPDSVGHKQLIKAGMCGRKFTMGTVGWWGELEGNCLKRVGPARRVQMKYGNI